ncbi:MAG: L-threonylcarbamoyladenylate synthase [Proteobacteria bacterium]|nr:L-threonylcarbamoyladenylate synthase [Pseudomonadota bacterium]
MMKTLYTYENPAPSKDLLEITRCLEDGGVMAYPTDVNWAFGCLANHKKALKRLQGLRKSSDHPAPLALMFQDMSHISNYTYLDNHAFRLLKKWLPGPYTILLKPHPRLGKLLPQKRPNVGVRIPKRPLLMEILPHLPCPLATTTVFLPNKKDNTYLKPSSAYDIGQYFFYDIDLLLDLSISLPMAETTVISLSDHHPVLIRQGIAPFNI